jgi:Na+/H+ antiporter NhaD/arsenite permease-like protein
MPIDKAKSIYLPRLVFTLTIALLALAVFSDTAFASDALDIAVRPDLTGPSAIFCVIVFILSYLFVMTEESSGLRKSKPVMLGAGVIWATIGYVAPDYGISHEQLRKAISHDLDEYSSLFLFLFAAMTYIAALEGARVFDVLRSWLVGKGLGYRALFWVTGVIAFFLSAIADNLTTALVMGAVILALGSDNVKFIALGMVNVVNAANAGGAFSPFGDITTLMVWQSGRIEFFEFFALFLPSVVAFTIPAIVFSFFVPTGKPKPITEQVTMVRGAKRAILLGILTIAMAICFEQFLGLPPFMGMMTGLSLLMFHVYFLRQTRRDGETSYEIFDAVKLVEWDTLLFFFGVMFSVGGLAFIGYLELASNSMYGSWGPTTANIVLGLVSAIIDNIPVMFAILTMGPEMNHFQWLLVTFTCGVGGTMLSVGSAAGVALMGTSKGHYTFMSHLKWTPVLLLGYAAGIGTHFLVN